MTATKPNRKSATNNQWAPGLSPSRIEGLTDGTLAIAMTILVLELPVPRLFDAVSHEDYPISFLDMWQEFYIYILGFLVLGIYWVLHHYMFHYIKRSDGVLNWLNILFLVFAALVPFSAKVLSANEVLIATSETEMTSAYGFFTLTTAASIMTLFAMWQYATRGSRLIDPGIDPRIVAAISRVILISTTIYLFGFVLSFFISWAGYIGFVAMVYMIGMTVYGRYIPAFGKR